jgi:hypothetical protein
MSRRFRRTVIDANRLASASESRLSSPNVKLVELAVNGTLMRGLALNDNLLVAGGQFLRESATSPCYRLWSINDRHPAMARVTDSGASIALEIWALPPAGIAQVLLQEPAGLCIGRIELADGSWVLGVLGEATLCAGQPDITAWGGWRTYISSTTDPPG